MKSKNFHIKWQDRWPAVLLSGLGLALSFPPFPFPFVNCIALIPLLRRWQMAADWRTVYLDWMYAFLILYVVTFSWPLRHDFSNVATASLSGVLLLPMTSAVAFAAALPIRRMLGTTYGLIAGIAFFLTNEWFWTHGPIAMPGTLLGHALANQLYVNQIVDVTGVSGLSLWILGINALGMLLYSNVRRLNKKIATALVLWLPIPFVYSTWQLQQHPENASQSTHVAVIQPGVASAAWSDETDRSRVIKMIRLTDSLLTVSSSLPDLVLWPETTLPRFAFPGDTLLTSLQHWTDASGFALAAGAIIQTSQGSAGTQQTNSAVLINSYAPVKRYDKNWLVPFAEFVPFEQAINQLQKLRVDAGGVAGYQPGQSQNMLAFNKAAVGTLICFESLFGNYTRKHILNGADFLIALSNVGWWGPGIAPTHYLNFSRLRAIETRSHLIINTVTGPAAIFDSKGRVIAKTRWMESGLMQYTIPHASTRTFYTKYGDWLSILAILTTFFAFIHYLFAKRSRRKSSLPT